MKKLLCGVDLGGIKLSTALISQEGEIIEKFFDCDHVGKSEAGLVEQIAGNVKRLLISNNLKESDLLGIGIGCAGHVRYRDGVLITTSNLKGFKNMIFDPIEISVSHIGPDAGVMGAASLTLELC